MRMTVLKCKMCGGDLNIQPGMTVAECLYCGSLQTIPNITNEKKATLYERADYYRRNNDYDKAMSIYEQLISEDNTDAEAHWLAVLCRYGIEYVEDPRSYKRIPTVNRLQYKSILNDPDYNDALMYADDTQYDLYQQEAVLINQIQKGILEVSKREEHFDIFICYKETDNQGRRTQDSVIAYDIYKELTKEGYRVFFARVTLEDKLGSAYEPFIFAALNSAKIMLVIGTTPENFQAVWVKNEWSRYLSLMQENDNKTLIPIYKDMNPYDMPEEFSYLQSQDYGKLGAVQDIVHGVEKILKRNKKVLNYKDTEISTSVDSTEALLKRAYQFVEDENWKDAKLYYNRVLDINPQCSNAYLIASMIDIRVKNRQGLVEYNGEIDKNSNFIKALKYADADEKKYLEEIIEESTENKVKELLHEATELMESGRIPHLRKAIQIFEIINDSYDVHKEISICKKRIETLKNKRNSRNKIIVMAIGMMVLFLISAILFANILKPVLSGNKAKRYIEKGEFDKAIDIYNSLGMSEEMLSVKIQKISSLADDREYKDAISIISELPNDNIEINKIKKEVFYKAALDSEEIGEYSNAIEYYSSIKGYLDSTEHMGNCYSIWINDCIQNNDLDMALKLTKDYHYIASSDSLKEDVAKKYIELNDFVSSAKILLGIQTEDVDDIKINVIKSLLDLYRESGDGKELDLVKKLLDSLNNSEVDDVKKCKYITANYYLEKEDYIQAINMFEEIESYDDSKDRGIEAKYQFILNNLDSSENRYQALSYLNQLRAINYKDCEYLYNKVSK